MNSVVLVGNLATDVETREVGDGRREKHMGLAYMTWPSESTRIKAVINDDEE